MDLISPNLNLPYLAPAQAQKHVTHNEALRQLDAIVQLSVARVADTPPSSPENGDRVIIGTSPSGDFTDKPYQLAAFQDGAWEYFTPKTGWRAYVEDAGELRIFDSTAWQVVSGGGGNGGSSETAAKFGINTTADTLNRLAVKSPATLLDNEGSGHQLKVNKFAQADTASLLFQTGYTGHAEMGLTGGQDFHIKTSLDGSVFNDSLIADVDTGGVYFPSGVNSAQMTTPIKLCGGPDSFYGLPNLNALSDGRSTITLTQNRVVFCAFYVDRPSELKGGFISLYGASTTPGAIIRAGIFKLGTANGNGWDIGERVVDFGTQAADVAGHKYFDLAAAMTIMPGWYAAAIGTDGAGAKARFLKVLQPGLNYFAPTGTGTGADIRLAGASNYLFSPNGTEIASGFSANWPSNPVVDVSTSNSFSHLLFVPKWTRWS